MESIAIIILAAGKGRRMGMDTPKVLAETGAGCLLHHVLTTAGSLNPEKIVVVTGHGREQVEKAVSDGADLYGYKRSIIDFVLQPQQLGTGDAARCALDSLSDFDGTVLILSGDVPLVESNTLSALMKRHQEEAALASLISVRTDKPGSYGRVIRAQADSVGRRPVLKITEAKDATEEELLCNEINSGIYAVNSTFLINSLSKLENKNAQQEYYLTDIIEQAVADNQKVVALLIDDIDEVQGVNTPSDLRRVLSVLKRRRVEELMRSGVIIDDPESVYIDHSVKIGAGTHIGPQVQLLGKTVIGRDTVIEGNAYLKNSSVGDNNILKGFLRFEDARVGADCNIGPFVQLRPGTEVADGVNIGNFVELKNTIMKPGSKANHLSYLGDAEIGENVNIGAGTITANYDGYTKNRTTIGAHASTGANSCLVAPVNIGAGAYIGAGSVITKNVETDALALSRAEQKEIKGWAKKRREKMKKT